MKYNVANGKVYIKTMDTDINSSNQPLTRELWNQITRYYIKYYEKTYNYLPRGWFEQLSCINTLKEIVYILQKTFKYEFTGNKLLYIYLIEVWSHR